MTVYHSERDGEVHFIREGEDAWLPLIDDSTVLVPESAPEWAAEVASRKGYSVKSDTTPVDTKPKPADA